MKLKTVMCMNFKKPTAMKSMIKHILFTAAISTLAVSCAKEIASPIENVDEQLVEVTLIAGNPEVSSATKTEMEGSQPYWSVNDAIGVSNGTSTNHEFSTDIAAKATSASFTGLTAVSSTLYAYYPFTNNGVGQVSEKYGAKVDLPANQNPTATSFDGSADIMVAKQFTVDPENKTVENLEFARLGAVVKIVLIDKDNTMTGSQHPTTVSMTAESTLAGRLLIDMQNQEISEPYYNPSSTVTANYTAETKYAIDGSNSTYLIVYPQTLAEGSKLTIVASTEDYTLSKVITVPDGGIELLPGKLTTLNVKFEATHITSAPGASLPFNDDFSWQTATGGSLSLVDSKYSAFQTAYADKGVGTVRLGTNSATGYLTTEELDLSGAFHVIVSAYAYNATDNSKIKVSVDDGTPKLASEAMTSTSTPTDYIFNFAAATKKSKVTITTDQKRAVLTNLQIISGTYALPPVINVTTANPMAVANTASTQTIEYTIDNPTAATLTAALQDPADTWISNIDYKTSGKVTFNVAAQSEGAKARSAVIVLSYTGAPNVEVKVNQAAGAGGTTTKTFTIASAEVVTNSGYKEYNTTVNKRDWVITFGGNNKSVGTNSGSRSKCTLGSYSKYAVSPVTKSSIAAAFASKTSLSNVSKISYTFTGGKNQTKTKVYLLYSSDNTTFSQISLTKGTQGATISSGTEFEFAECSGCFAVLFEATNNSGDWRIDDVTLTFTYSE